MKPFVRITRIPYEEPDHLNLIVTASNGRVEGELEIYTNADDLRAFADRLAGFPRHSTDSAIWELGSEGVETQRPTHHRRPVAGYVPVGVKRRRFCFVAMPWAIRCMTRAASSLESSFPMDSRE